MTQPKPRTATPEEVSAILRSPDTGPDAPYPAAIGLFCDECLAEVVNDYIVSDSMDQEERFEVARKHLRTMGWDCTSAGDFCPSCTAGSAS